MQGLIKSSAYHDSTPQQDHPAYFRTSSSTVAEGVPGLDPQPNGSRSPVATTVRDQQVLDSRDLLSRASNIIREATEVDGVIFLDARTTSSGNARVAKSNVDPFATGSDTDMPTDNDPDHKPCQILGVSTNEKSNTDVDDINPATSLGHCSETFLRRLLRRYPKGNIWHIEDLSSAEESDDTLTSSTSDEMPDQKSQTRRTQGRKTTSGAHLATVFAGARTIAFFPLWDTFKERWFAGVSRFAQTCDALEMFNLPGV